MTFTPENDVFRLAADIVCNTSQSVFLTGKAGTGKTTFLHYIKEHTDKNLIVAAPTGVAAINAGGVTLHSLLQLPFEPFIPNLEGKKKLEFHFKLRKSKIDMLRELELLIIDEVSMLRADLLDAIDYMLKRYRNSQQPFGGVQMLFIGDLFQLPPVVQAPEWELMKPYYVSPFFFHAQALQDNIPLYIELKTIYRQQDCLFIDILNRIRNNCVTSQDLQTLNKHYNPSFKLPETNKYIVLCTHNYKADRINVDELAKLAKQAHRFKGEIRGDFSENALPTEQELLLKEGAQVMFVKNDAGETRRYHNGKLAEISRLLSDKIYVRFENGDEMELEEETWRNVRYKLNEDSGEIEEEELGSFKQFPIRLAWAITIHKSQGLTFDRVVIDAGQAFAPGQVYVALSRCTSLEGIVLFSRITPQSISTDEHAIAIARYEQSQDYLSEILALEKPRYCAQQLKKYFDWTPFVRSLHSFYELVTAKKIPNKEEVLGMITQMSNKVIEQQEIARNFVKELDVMLNSGTPNINHLQNRVQKASMYFHKEIQEYIINPIEVHLDSLKRASKVKLYLQGVHEIHTTLLRQQSKLEHIAYGNEILTAGLVFEKQSPIIESPIAEIGEKKGKPSKGDSQLLSLSLFNAGKTIADIAYERNLAASTVTGHLIEYILTGDVSVERLVDARKVEHLLSLIKEGNTTLSSIKEKANKECSYADIKAVLNHLRFLKNGN